MDSHPYKNVHDKNPYKKNMDSHSYINMHGENPYKNNAPAMGAVFGLGVGAGGLGAFLAADACKSGSSAMAAAALV